MTPADLFMTALCIWREARGEGKFAMTAVACVIRNRVAKRNSSPYVEVIRPLAFSSISSPGDPQLKLWPKLTDLSWLTAQKVAAEVLTTSASDPTKGATLYFDDSISFPKSWNPAAVQATVKLGRLNFFREV